MLEGTRHKGLTLGGSHGSMHRLCNYDSDHARDFETRRSKSGYLFFLGEYGTVS